MHHLRCFAFRIISNGYQRIEQITALNRAKNSSKFLQKRVKTKYAPLSILKLRKIVRRDSNNLLIERYARAAIVALVELHFQQFLPWNEIFPEIFSRKQKIGFKFFPFYLSDTFRFVDNFQCDWFFGLARKKILSHF